MNETPETGDGFHPEEGADFDTNAGNDGQGGGDRGRPWSVRIIDLSGASGNDTVEEVRDFLDLMHANAFARAYVRDSIERCRLPGASTKEVLESWFAFGENAEVVDAGDDGWKSDNELDDFAASPATPMERDWRAIDPRRLIEDGAADSIVDDDDLDDEDGLEIIRH